MITDTLLNIQFPPQIEERSFELPKPVAQERYQLMQMSVIAYPNNEIRIRTTPYSESKRKAEEKYFLGSYPFYPSCFLTAREDYIAKAAESGIKPGWGKTPTPTKFTRRARKKLQRIGGVVDKLYPVSQHKSIFLTGTLPGSTPAALQAIADYSGYLVNRLNQWLRRKSPNHAAFYVWENQKRGALHLHYCYSADDAQVVSDIQAEFKQFWIKLLLDICDKSGVDLFERVTGGTWQDDLDKVQTRAEIVEKSVAAYLSKYSSKTDGKGYCSYYPSRWWGCSRYLGNKLHEMTLSYTCNLSYSQWKAAQNDIVAMLRRIAPIPPFQCWDRYGTGHNTCAYHNPEDAIFDDLVATLPEQEFINPEATLWLRAAKSKDDKDREDAALELWHEQSGESYYERQKFIREMQLYAEQSRTDFEFEGIRYDIIEMLDSVTDSSLLLRCIALCSIDGSPVNERYRDFILGGSP